MNAATDSTPARITTEDRDATVFGVILAISFCHLLNDMMQSLLPAIYPNLKARFGLNFGQIGLVTLAYQLTASLLQPLVGLYADRRPTPLALPGGALFSLAGLAVLSVAHSYPVLLAGACLLGVGSSVFHPESSRVARMAAGGRHGLAQSLFQVGGNIGQALPTSWGSKPFIASAPSCPPSACWRHCSHRLTGPWSIAPGRAW